eukprot:CAMPEP_0174742136 /NCGR_PEP_ID=MMETSP1094-20130205/78112_1 /TAXON_ID=156173 /ORGANISM="Chrysochromulina brevifilum, Strain UTEX LB 985" /LENGTH=64 /DNA_ID=CAMNT_0015946149 /DNA_START=33 /DNA_END=225 /DNA_ORIENTATION=+
MMDPQKDDHTEDSLGTAAADLVERQVERDMFGRLVVQKFLALRNAGVTTVITLRSALPIAGACK